MKRTLTTLSAILVCWQLAARLPDTQVMELIRQYSSQGMGQTEIAAELSRRGVTLEQLQRIQQNAAALSGGTQNPSLDGSLSGVAAGRDFGSRLRTDPTRQRLSTTQTDGVNVDPTAARHGGQEMSPYTDPSAAGYPFAATAGMTPASIDSLFARAGRDEPAAIFGHDVFSSKRLTFEPSLNIATPENYTLGPGDEVIIDIWGDSEQTVRQTISPDGTIVVNRLGPVTLGGSTVKEADAMLRRRLSAIYSPEGEGSHGTSIKLSLGAIRSIQVHVMGEVENPGTYTLPSLASLFHLLYSAGGVNGIGSLREISVSRAGERVATVDVYAYLLEGRTDVDIALRDGDVVVVPPYRNLVEVAGRVKRPMKYEMKPAETLSELLDYSGGFAGDAHRGAVTVVRRGGLMQQVHDVESDAYADFTLADGDSVAVGGGIERFSNRLEITGAVFRPGLYSSSDPAARSVRALVAKASGVMGDAAVTRAVLTREKADYSPEALSVDVGAILAGVAPDVELRNGDRLHIPSIFDLREKYTVTVKGAVLKPGEYDYADNLTVGDMIVAAGGLSESASTARADVYRRIKQPGSISESDFRSESFSLPIHIDLDAGADELKLRPFDMVVIRTSPGYEKQKPVAVVGEVLFPGDYTLVKREERLSDLIRKSGGALSTAYLQGAKLVRRRAEDEQARAQAALRLTQMGGRDSLSSAALNVEQNYSVGIELDKAMAHPGSDYDLVLTEGDVLFVPEYVGTVAVSGAVLFPNTVSYREGMSIRDYIDQAGGYAGRARKKAQIVVYMNGTISRVKWSGKARIAPGCEIVVPYKSARGAGRVSVTDLLSVGSSATSAASLITSITGL